MKVIAYQLGSHHMPIEPASNRRSWMDSTVHQYAYRCLPLQIANANGWVLSCPSDIIVSWDGGNHKDNLTIHFSDKSWEFASSSFGHGIVTFHTGFLFRTVSTGPQKYDMMVTGLPNYWYDFMMPLTGIVETFWNPATFTMNWKLRKAGTYKINTGQPLVFITPIPHELPEIEAEIVPIQSDLAVWRDFDTWRQSRNKMIQALDVMDRTGKATNGIDPSNPSTQWQKDYFQGKKMDGEKVPEHHTKRRFLPFNRRTPKDASLYLPLSGEEIEKDGTDNSSQD